MFQKMLQGGNGGSGTPTDSVLLAQGRLEKNKDCIVTLKEDIDDFYIDFICHIPSVSPPYGLLHVTSGRTELIDGKDFISSGELSYSKTGKTIKLQQNITSNNAFFVLLRYI